MEKLEKINHEKTELIMKTNNELIIIQKKRWMLSFYVILFYIKHFSKEFIHFFDTIIIYFLIIIQISNARKSPSGT